MAKKAKLNPVSVDIVSDIVCPWCWLGKAYYDEAVRKSGLQVQTVWRPYMLDPTVPEDGVDYKTYMKTKFGGGSDSDKDRFAGMRTHLEDAAPDAGIKFRFSELTVRPNTLRAHRLVRWARGQGLGSEAKAALFKAYFEQLRDIGDVTVLSDIAGSIGMDADLVSELLATDKDAASVQEEILFYRGLGISGVPTFIYNGQFAVQGAQPTSVHLDAIKKAARLPAPEDN